MVSKDFTPSAWGRQGETLQLVVTECEANTVSTVVSQKMWAA